MQNDYKTRWIQTESEFIEAQQLMSRPRTTPKAERDAAIQIRFTAETVCRFIADFFPTGEGGKTESRLAKSPTLIDYKVYISERRQIVKDIGNKIETIGNEVNRLLHPQADEVHVDLDIAFLALKKLYEWTAAKRPADNSVAMWEMAAPELRPGTVPDRPNSTPALDIPKEHAVDVRQTEAPTFTESKKGSDDRFDELQVTKPPKRAPGRWVLVIIAVLAVIVVIVLLTRSGNGKVVGEIPVPTPGPDSTVGPSNTDSNKVTTEEHGTQTEPTLPPPPPPPPSPPIKLTRKGNMILIPGGKFMMGSPEQEGEKSERPCHQVVVSGFYMDTTEVSQADYERVMGINPSYFRKDSSCPVERVSWLEAAEYCNKVGKRLPTEAEWEYAARAGDTTAKKYYWGNGKIGEYAWHDGNAKNVTHPTAKLMNNRFGLYDMSGNVAEWCNDWYSETYTEKSAGINPRGPDTGESRVVRGGAWFDPSYYVRSAARNNSRPDLRDNKTGFRCACSKE